MDSYYKYKNNKTKFLILNKKQMGSGPDPGLGPGLNPVSEVHRGDVENNFASELVNIFIIHGFSLSLTFFNKISDNIVFLQQISLDNRNTIFLKILYLILKIDDLLAVDKDKLILICLTKLFNQTLSDPPIYVSHGTDHSLRVSEYCSQMYNNIDVLQDSIKNLYINENQSADDKIDFNKIDFNKIELIVRLLGLLHDVGYADISNCISDTMDKCNIPKFTHAFSGGKELSESIAPLLYNIFPKNIIDSFILAIMKHNYDDVTCENNPVPQECIFIANDSAHTKNLNNIKIIREYVPGPIETLPFLFLIRISDNLDFVHTRLTPIQRDSDFVLLLKHFYENPILAKSKINKDFVTYEREKNNLFYKWDSKIFKPWMSSEDMQTLKLMIENIKEDDFLHIYSNWIVDKSSISQNPINKNQFILTVEFIEPQNPELSVSQNPIASVYQISRMKKSLKSLTINGKSFVDMISVKLKNGSQGSDEIRELTNF